MATLEELNDLNKKKFKEAGAYTKQLEPVKNRIRYYTDIIKRFPSSSAEFKDATAKLKEAKVIEKDLTDKRDAAFNESQKALKDAKTLTKNKKLEDAITKEKENKKKTEALGGDTTESDKKITKLEQEITKPMPPGTFTPVERSAFTPAAKVTVTGPTATPAAKTPGTPGQKPLPKKKAETPPKPGKEKPANIDEIFALVQSQYGPIDAIFKENPQLKELMIKAVGDPANPKDDYTPQRFLNELQTTTWFASNAGPIRQRQFYKKQYEDLLKKGGNAEELAQTTEYGRGLASAKQALADAAVAYGSSVDPTQLDMLATQVYDLANEGNAPIVQAAVRAKIKYTPGAALGGAAGVSLAELQRTASANGLNLEKQFGSNLQGWLQKIAQGESPETYKQIIRDTAKIGLPDRVASLVDKGIDLETIYNPYRNMMAATLEVNPETIKLNDPTLRMAIGPEKEMSLYDYQRSLRKDARWQYTDNARQEVSSIAKTVLKDFGFQG
jgi:hypothetical protein